MSDHITCKDDKEQGNKASKGQFYILPDIADIGIFEYCNAVNQLFLVYEKIKQEPGT